MVVVMFKLISRYDGVKDLQQERIFIMTDKGGQ
ncbi:hypothetical protein L861_04525 [Litchfieldella anticariensis FP35 = DSM 16096]|uniref:Uncharacterized protein n=1 Tax=Litchfieldella anticariensis (strain DSM 16096 / CECT 5854 / CIP 108499 / LMG 22089 / FP35) TaxID=1121939 RepID=S2L9N5_LITA3|nr:hypothetical protein L861_04525 [Halomonas anticariensis FP35 = DSM 16096]